MLVASLVGWVVVFMLASWVVDPYGVSPLNISVPHINRYKPKRVEIDRLIKPYEVWAKQPVTVFLGTSRIHQSIDPSVLDGTPMAPAYNASIPASSLSLNIAHLKQYIELDPRLKNVFAEIFLYNFLGQGQEYVEKPFWQFVTSSAGLHASLDTLWATAVTVYYNVFVDTPGYEIKPGGYFYYPPGHDASGPFGGYPEGIWKLHDTRPNGLHIHEPAMESFRELVQIAGKRGLNLRFIYTPNHAYDDYYIDYIDGWGVVEDWLRRLSGSGDVYSFSQPNELVYEPVTKRMRHWNDPYHFSADMGSAIQRRLAGLPTTGLPGNFMVRLTPENVAEHVRLRRERIRAWADEHPEFVVRMKDEHDKWQKARAITPEATSSR